ncbi:winged-helix domain-containing protein [Haloferax sp. DFSO60]|uniref:winged-helix domain-containing protein n=1 Tax=Haloferax sp. DFSO60 TaxID=3388652 RepID=UPI00397BA8E2
MQPAWWSKYDDPILQFLADTGAAVPPRVILFNLERREIASPHRSTIKRRLQRLQEYGLVEKVGEEGYYVISELGEAYLSGEIDAAELDAVE